YVLRRYGCRPAHGQWLRSAVAFVHPHRFSLRPLVSGLVGRGRDACRDDERSKEIMMKRILIQVFLAVGLVMGAASAAVGGFRAIPVRCGIDAVVAGTVCLDRYEASVWRVPDPSTTNATLVRRIQRGVATRAELTAGGATRLGMASDAHAHGQHEREHSA